MIGKGSLYFCDNPDCASNLSFGPRWRRVCRSKKRFYGKEQHNCGYGIVADPACSWGYITKAAADQHGLVLVNRSSDAGRQLQEQFGWKDTDFLFVPEGTIVKPIKVKKRKAEHVPFEELDEEAQDTFRKQVLSCPLSMLQVP